MKKIVCISSEFCTNFQNILFKKILTFTKLWRHRLKTKYFWYNAWESPFFLLPKMWLKCYSSLITTLHTICHPASVSVWKLMRGEVRASHLLGLQLFSTVTHKTHWKTWGSNVSVVKKQKQKLGKWFSEFSGLEPLHINRNIWVQIPSTRLRATW